MKVAIAFFKLAKQLKYAFSKKMFSLSKNQINPKSIIKHMLVIKIKLPSTENEKVV